MARAAWLSVAGEIVVLIGLFSLYKFGRMLADGSVQTAWSNAYEVLHIEDALHLPSELKVQVLLLDAHWLVEAANIYYAWVHFPATAAFLVWLYLCRHTHYAAMRNWMAIVTAGATVGHIAFPLAPPRMLTSIGFVDTASQYGPSVYSTPDVDSFANQYAAMPSLHVAWAVVVAVGIIAATHSRWRWVALAHPILTTLVVVVTANHYWMDAIMALALLAAAVPVVTWIERVRGPRRRLRRSFGTPLFAAQDEVPASARE